MQPRYKVGDVLYRKNPTMGNWKIIKIVRIERLYESICYRYIDALDERTEGYVLKLATSLEAENLTLLPIGNILYAKI